MCIHDLFCITCKKDVVCASHSSPWNVSDMTDGVDAVPLGKGAHELTLEQVAWKLTVRADDPTMGE
jgi:hypothetical protein